MTKKVVDDIKYNVQEETYGLSWQAITAIMLAIQKGAVEMARGNDFDTSECIFDFQLVERTSDDGPQFAEDPGLYVVNPPAFKPLTKEEAQALMGEE